MANSHKFSDFMRSSHPIESKFALYVCDYFTCFMCHLIYLNCNIDCSTAVECDSNVHTYIYIYRLSGEYLIRSYVVF